MNVVREKYSFMKDVAINFQIKCSKYDNSELSPELRDILYDEALTDTLIMLETNKVTFDKRQAMQQSVIEVEGYKTFKGTMLIKYFSAEYKKITGTWLYRPDTGYWYCKGESYPSCICEPLEVLNNG